MRHRRVAVVSCRRGTKEAGQKRDILGTKEGHSGFQAKKVECPLFCPRMSPFLPERDETRRSFESGLGILPAFSNYRHLRRPEAYSTAFCQL